MRFQDKTVIITGSTKGIGRAMAFRFAAEGANVVVNGRDQAGGDEVVKAIRDKGGSATFIRADLAREDEVKRLIETARGTYGGIDFLINNAAPTDIMRATQIGDTVRKGDDGRIAEMTTEGFDRILKVGLYASFWTLKYSIPIMLERGGGVVVNISSGAGVAATEEHTAYGAAKGGLHSLTRQVAVDYGNKGIRSNCIVVGAITGAALTDEMFDDPIAGPMLRETSITGKRGQPQDIAGIAAFLCSDDAAFVQGTLIYGEGGLFSKIPLRNMHEMWAALATSKAAKEKAGT